MPRGGRRPGTGGARPGAGRPRKHPKPEPVSAAQPRQTPEVETPPEPVAPSPTDQPLDYLLKVMRDPNSNAEMRMRAAATAAPYVHAKVGEQGKKDQKNEAAKKVASRFASPAPPPRNSAH